MRNSYSSCILKFNIVSFSYYYKQTFYHKEIMTAFPRPSQTRSIKELINMYNQHVNRIMTIVVKDIAIEVLENYFNPLFDI